MTTLEAAIDVAGTVPAVEPGSTLAEPRPRASAGQSPLPRRRRLARAYRHSLDRASWC